MAAEYSRDLHALKYLVESIFVSLREQKPVSETMGVELFDYVSLILHEVFGHRQSNAHLHHILSPIQFWQALLQSCEYAVVEELVFQFYLLAVQEGRHYEVG